MALASARRAARHLHFQADVLTKLTISTLFVSLTTILPNPALAQETVLASLNTASLNREDREMRRLPSASKVSSPRRKLEQLEEGPGFKVLNPDHAYGTELTVRQLRHALAIYHEQFPEAAPVQIMDLSRRGGGRLGPHASHRTGRDVDVRLVLKTKNPRVVEGTPSNLDVERTWFLMSALIETGDVEYIFLNRKLHRTLYRYATELGLDRERLGELFQYPHGASAKVGVIRHEPGHLCHFHVRFRRPPRAGGPAVAARAEAGQTPTL
jgi:hypothetical protein